MISTASGIKKSSTIVAVELSIRSNDDVPEVGENWRRPRVVLTSQGAPTTTAIPTVCSQPVAARTAAAGQLKTQAGHYLPIVSASDWIFVPMFVPRAWKAMTAANATSAAATAYSESSRPVSSRKNFLIILLLLLDSDRRCYLDEPANVTLTMEDRHPVTLSSLEKVELLLPRARAPQPLIHISH